MALSRSILEDRPSFIHAATSGINTVQYRRCAQTTLKHAHTEQTRRQLRKRRLAWLILPVAPAPKTLQIRITRMPPHEFQPCNAQVEVELCIRK